MLVHVVGAHPLPVAGGQSKLLDSLPHTSPVRLPITADALNGWQDVSNIGSKDAQDLCGALLVRISMPSHAVSTRAYGSHLSHRIPNHASSNPWDRQSMMFDRLCITDVPFAVLRWLIVPHRDSDVCRWLTSSTLTWMHGHACWRPICSAGQCVPTDLAPKSPLRLSPICCHPCHRVCFRPSYPLQVTGP